MTFQQQHTEANYHAWLRAQREREEAARQVEQYLEAVTYNVTAQATHFAAMVAAYEAAAR